MLKEKYLDCLNIIMNRLKDSNLDWAFIGSLSLNLKGIDIFVKDIDIITTKEDIIKFQEIFKEFIVNSVKFVVKEDFSSYILILNINSIEVEIIANHNQLDSEEKDIWIKNNYLSAKEYVNFNELQIPIINLKQQLHAYSVIGRTDKVKLISDYLKNEKN